jgi:preprotein translocase subunit YajC
MISDLLENIEGIQVYYILGLLIFFICFLVIFIRTMRRPAKEMKKIKESILNDNDSEEIIIS